jgi:uncharacterized membrane protein SpoIIM required for sporulation
VDLEVFVAEHRADWERLDKLTRRHRRLTGEEIDELIRLYQRTSAGLSALQAAGLDPALASRLSSQLARSRTAISGAPSAGWQAVGRFASISFPAAAYRIRWWWLGCAAGSALVALLVGWRVAGSAALQSSLLPRSAAAKLVHHEFRHYYSAYNGQSFAAHVWTNNALVAAETVIFGVLLGVPVLLVLFENALNIGVVGGLMTAYGKAAEFWGLILPHGILELSAVFLAAAAGLRLGWTIIDPGLRPRVRALAEEGRALVTIAIGLVFVLFLSGAIEAFVTPSSLPTWTKIGIGVTAEIAFLGYVGFYGRQAAAAGETGEPAEVPDQLPVVG